MPLARAVRPDVAALQVQPDLLCLHYILYVYGPLALVPCSARIAVRCAFFVCPCVVLVSALSLTLVNSLAFICSAFLVLYVTGITSELGVMALVLQQAWGRWAELEPSECGTAASVLVFALLYLPGTVQCRVSNNAKWSGSWCRVIWSYHLVDVASCG